MPLFWVENETKIRGRSRLLVQVCTFEGQQLGKVLTEQRECMNI